VLYSAAAQNPDKAIKFDFINIHHTNAAVFFPVFLKHPAIPTHAKVRLLEWKGRFDLINYLARNAPQLYITDISTYLPKHPEQGWPEIFERATLYPDDGHASKLVRVMALGEKVCGPYSGQKGFDVEPGMWIKMGHMAIDSVDTGSSHWITNGGWGEEKWEGVPSRPGGKKSDENL